jgi:hypothetical protein
LRKMVLLRWSVGAGCVPGGAVGGARFRVLRFSEGCVPIRYYAGRGKVSVAGERGVGVGRRLVGRRRTGRRRAGRVRRRRAWRGRRVGQQPPPWPVTGDGAPRYKVSGEVVAFQRFLERAAEIHLWAPNRPWLRHPTGE